jgi:tetratricopeptide (TPR) repeat protein
MGQHEAAREAWNFADTVAGAKAGESEACDAITRARENWSSSDAWEQLANTLDKAGKGSEAIAEARAALRSHRDINGSLLPLVNRLVNQLPAEIGELIDEMLQISPNNSHYVHLYGVAKRKAGQDEEAIPYLSDACELEPSNGTYWYALGRALLDTGRTAAARNALERAATSDPPHPKARERLRDLGPAE